MTADQDPVGRELAGSGWTPTHADHPNRDLDPGLRAWQSPDRRLLLFASSPRSAGHLIGLVAPHAPGQTEKPLWQINGGPVPAPVAAAMARAAATAPERADDLAAAGWSRDPDSELSFAIAGLTAWTGPAPSDGDRSWSAVLFPMPTAALSLWTVKGAHGGQDCTLMATADTPAHVIAAAVSAAPRPADAVEGP